MSKIFVNFTNHSSLEWDDKQKKAAERYGEIFDVPFPAVDPHKGEAYIEELAKRCLAEILKLEPAAVLCQGEFCLVYRLVSLLKEKGIPVFAACSSRMVEVKDGKKEVLFQFCRFREYI